LRGIPSYIKIYMAEGSVSREGFSPCSYMRIGSSALKDAHAYVWLANLVWIQLEPSKETWSGYYLSIQLIKFKYHG
jgi:hypothetical protein